MHRYPWPGGSPRSARSARLRSPSRQGLRLQHLLIILCCAHLAQIASCSNFRNASSLPLYRSRINRAGITIRRYIKSSNSLSTPYGSCRGKRLMSGCRPGRPVLIPPAQSANRSCYPLHPPHAGVYYDARLFTTTRMIRRAKPLRPFNPRSGTHVSMRYLSFHVVRKHGIVPPMVEDIAFFANPLDFLTHPMIHYRCLGGKGK